MLHDDGSRGHDWLINEYKKMPGYEIMRNITGFTGAVLNKKFPFWPPLLIKKDVRVKVWKRRHGNAKHWFERNQEDAFDHEQELIWAHNGAREHDEYHPYKKNS